MESFKDYIEGLKKEKEKRLEEDIIDEIADKVFKKLQEKFHPPYCPFDCPYYFHYPYCPYCPRRTYTITWQTYPVDPTDSTYTYNSWRYGEGEKDE